MLQERRETDIYHRGTSRSKGWRGNTPAPPHKQVDANSLMTASIWGALALRLTLYEQRQQNGNAPGQMESRDGAGAQMIRGCLFLPKQ